MRKPVSQVVPRLNPWLLLCLLYGGMGVMLYLRLQEVDKQVAAYIACPGCFTPVVIANDLLVLALMTAILLFAAFFRPDRLARSLQVLAGIPALMYLADLLLFKIFHTRLFMSDVALFIREREAIWDQFHSWIGGALPALAMLAVVIVFFTLLYRMQPLRSLWGKALLAFLLLTFLSISLGVEKPPYVNSWAVNNVLTANLASGSKIPYSRETIDRVRAAEPPRVRSGQQKLAGRNENVIIVLLESWSSWHSALFGGFEDWTPELDRAAMRGRRYVNFHAIGFSTDKGLMGILAGVPLWAPFIHWYQATPFHSTWSKQNSLPGVFADGGYRTSFLTTGPKEVYRKGDWLAGLGFDYIEGREHPFYEDKPRFAFKAASDQALYQRAEQWRASAETPYLLVLETVTTHQPYRDPDSGKRSLEKAMKYADRVFGEYLQQLEQGGFFENGLLVVVSDHRSMTPITRVEFDRFGLDAYSRVPMFVIGRDFEPDSIDQRVFSQSDLAPSFDVWLDGQAELGPLDRVMFDLEPGELTHRDDPGTACALHARGNERGRVNVICPGGQGVVAMRGDKTAFIESAGLSAAQQSFLIDEIARIRLRGLDRHQREMARRQQ